MTVSYVKINDNSACPESRGCSLLLLALFCLHWLNITQNGRILVNIKESVCSCYESCVMTGYHSHLNNEANTGSSLVWLKRSLD